MQKLTSLSERSQQQSNATKKTTNPDELSDNELLGHANRLKARLLSVKTSNNSSWVNSKNFKTPSHNREKDKYDMNVWKKLK